MADRNHVLRFALRLALLVLFGALLVALLWDTLNELLAGNADARRIALAAALLVAFLAFLALAARSFRRPASNDEPRVRR